MLSVAQGIDHIEVLDLGRGYFNLPEYTLSGVNVMIEGLDNSRTKLILTGAGLALNNSAILILKNINVESSGGEMQLRLFFVTVSEPSLRLC